MIWAKEKSTSLHPFNRCVGFTMSGCQFLNRVLGIENSLGVKLQQSVFYGSYFLVGEGKLNSKLKGNSSFRSRAVGRSFIHLSKLSVFLSIIKVPIWGFPGIFSS